MAIKSMNVPLPVGSYKYESNKVSTQRLVNMYSQVVEQTNSVVNTGSSFALLSIPGSTSAVTLDDNSIGIRGMYGSSTGPAPDFTERLYVASGPNVYRVNPDASVVKIGSVGSDSSRIYMNESGGLDSQLCVIDGHNLYACPLSATDATIASTWQTISLPSIAGTDNTPIVPTQMTNLNGHIILNSINSDQFYYSLINDVLSTSAWQALNFYTKYASSDVIVALATIGGSLIVFGPKSFEVWTETGNSLNPFSRQLGSAQWIGCQSPNSVAVLQDTLFWLGAGPVGHNIVFAMNAAGQVERISTNALEYQFARFNDPAGSVGFCYSDEGNYFYVLTFLDDDRTFVYDLSTKVWHERATRDAKLNINHQWNPMYAAFCYGDLYFGSINTPTLLFLDSESQQEWNGIPIVKTIVTPLYYDSYNNFIIREFMVYCNTGETSILSGQGSDPQMILQMSEDGGYTWSDEFVEPLGKQGEYLQTVRWFNLGESRNAVIKLTVSDPISLVVISAKLNITPMRND